MLKFAFGALSNRKLRSALTILGIMVGSAIILALVASSSGLNAGITSSIGKTGTNILTIRSASSFFLCTPSGCSAPSSSYRLSPTDLTYLKTVSGVVGVYPFYEYPATVSNGGETLQATLVGIDLSALPVLYQGLSVGEGTIPLTGDTTSAAVGWSIANPVSGTPIGLHQMVSVSITLRGAKSPISYSVLASAILTEYGNTLFADVDDTIYVSLQAATFLSKSPYFSGIYVVVGNADDVQTVESTLTTYYGQNVRIISPGQILSSITSITSQLTVFLGSIGAVSLFVATVGIVNTMYVAVMERRREIGILKAIGYTPNQIMWMFLCEAGLTGAIGGLCGLILGYALSFLIGGFLGGATFGGPRIIGPGSASAGSTPAIQPVFSPQLLLFSLLFPIALATIAGIYPAWKAARMNPLDALRYE